MTTKILWTECLGESLLFMRDLPSAEKEPGR